MENTDKIGQILSQLNEVQKRAVQCTEGPLLIIAGAGSGKTRVLTYRIAYLLELGIPSEQILALTFTNKAAGEMKNRISKLVDFQKAERIWAGTFHSIFARILRYEAKFISYTSNFSIYDSDDSLALIKRIMNELNISQQMFNPNNIRSRISSAKNSMIDWIEYSKKVNSRIEKQTSIIYEAYERQLIKNNAMDFDDLLINLIILFQNKQVLEKYQERFQYILVDEFQDTNRAQYIAIKLLSNKHKNICVVGDDAQSIYKWRGADIRNILDFQKDYPDSKIIRLEQNYRSTKTILNAAGNIIKQNVHQIPKKLWTDNIDGDKILVVECLDDFDESYKVVRKIKDFINKNNYQPKDFAILYRTNAQSLILENALRAESLPYVIIGGIAFYKRKEIKDVLAYLRILINNSDNDALLRIVNEPPRGLGLVSVKHLLDYAEMNNISILEAFRQANQIDDLQPKAKKSAQDFASMIDKFISLKDKLYPPELVQKYIENTGLLEMYKEIDTEDSLDRFSNIQQLITDIFQYFTRNDKSTLEDYLQQISLITDIDETDLSQNHIKLMTLHSAKGLEFPIVFITGMEQGLFPLIRSDKKDDDLEEERRLFYVGVTRAMKGVVLTYALQRAIYGELSNQFPSRFLNEIDNQYLEYEFSDHQRFQKNKNNLKHNEGTYIDEDSKFETYSQVYEEQDYRFKVGDIVVHPIFGKGKVVGLSGVGNMKQAIVYFDSVGKKRLMLQYAKLSKVE